MASVTCKLNSCKKEVTKATGKVEVRAFQISTKDKPKLKADWNEDGEAVFHPDCWKRIKYSAKGDNKDKAGGDLDLCDLEVKLVTDAHKTAEFHDAKAHVKSEAARVAKMLKDAEYCIAFTGAGISTAAGIGDFRGKDGKWTDKDKKQEHGAKGGKSKGGRGYSLAQLRPTYTHEAIVKLLELGHLKYLISQNTDGLHRLSGVPEPKISELHGNAFTQRCEKCEARYDFPRGHRTYSKTDVPPKPCERCRINHRTGQICEKKGCGGYLMNTIINFGDYLEGPILSRAEDNAKKADLVLCLGSTLMVSPANSLVEMGHQPIRLVICNRQGTPYDNYCAQKDAKGASVGSRVFGDCDAFMKEVMCEVLGDAGLKEWEDGRASRMARYDEKRT